MSEREIEWVWSLCLGRHQCSARAYICVQYCVCFLVQGGSGSVCLYPNSISLSICMASQWVQGKSNGCGHCALGVTSVVHLLIHVYSIVSVSMYRTEEGVYVFILIQLARVLL